jgi:uncharacterized protein (DUF2384 family)
MSPCATALPVDRFVRVMDVAVDPSWRHDEASTFLVFPD